MASLQVACALNHMGLIQVPGILVERALQQGKLVPVLPERAEIGLSLSIMYPNKQYLAPQVRLFIDWVIALIRERKGEWIK